MLTTAHLIYGLNALSRASEGNYFEDGHRGGAIISGLYLCKESAVEEGLAKLLSNLINKHWANTKLCAKFPNEEAQPSLSQQIVDVMLANIYCERA